MDIDFVSVLKEKREIVWSEINKYLSVGIEKSYPNDIISKYENVEDLHWKLIREYPERRGKYVRPTLTLLACEAMGGDPQKAIKTAAAMQTSEDWILNHDDFEDDSEERRGKPCRSNFYLRTMHHLFYDGVAFITPSYVFYSPIIAYSPILSGAGSRDQTCTFLFTKQGSIN